MNLKRIVELGEDLSVQVFGLDGIQDADLECLTTGFRHVWSCISSPEKDIISQFWTGNNPILELAESIPGENIATTDGGRRILFCWRACKDFPGPTLHAVIAHELGHVYQWAIGKGRHNLTIDDLPGFKKGFYDLPFPLRKDGIVEFHADELARKWGFDPILPYAALLQKIDNCDGNSVTKKKPLSEKLAYRMAKSERLASFYEMR